MSVEDGFGHGEGQRLRGVSKECCDCLGAIIFMFMFTTMLFISCLILSGPSPSFILQDVKLYAFNISTTTSTITSILQITILSRNPSGDTGIYFDKLDVYASYRNQQITLPTMLPPTTYLGPNDVTAWYPYLNGTEVPVSPYLVASLVEDKNAGNVLISVKVIGRLRSEFPFGSRRYGLEVSCTAYIMFENKNGSEAIGSAVQNSFVEGCKEVF